MVIKLHTHSCQFVFTIRSLNRHGVYSDSGRTRFHSVDTLNGSASRLSVRDNASRTNNSVESFRVTPLYGDMSRLLIRTC